MKEGLVGRYQKCCILPADWTRWIAWIYVMERPEILVLICPLVWMHLQCNVQGVPGCRVDVESFMLLGSVFFSFSGFCFKQCLLINPAHTAVYFSHNQEVWFLFQHCLFAQNLPLSFICPSRSPLHLSAPWKPMNCFTIWRGRVCQPSTISRGSPVCTSPVWWLYRSYWPTAQTTAWRRSI